MIYADRDSNGWLWNVRFGGCPKEPAEKCECGKPHFAPKVERWDEVDGERIPIHTERVELTQAELDAWTNRSEVDQERYMHMDPTWTPDVNWHLGKLQDAIRGQREAEEARSFFVLGEQDYDLAQTEVDRYAAKATEHRDAIRVLRAAEAEELEAGPANP